jgi:hypothetical protein
MKNNFLKKGILFPGVLAAALTLAIAGCASTPYDRPDQEKIRQNSDKGMQDLKEEEIRHGNESDY